MISHKHKCIFVHIPKTGGASFENVIWPLRSDKVVENLRKGFVKPYYNKYQTGGLQHLTSRQIKEEVGATVFDAYYKFTIVRNPWEKAVSQYSYMIQKRENLRRFIGMTTRTSFRKYLNLILEKEHVQWMKQVDFIYDANGQSMVDNIIRFENIDQGFHSIIKHLGIPHTSLPHINKSKRKHYTKYYDQESIQIVADLYKEDIEAFNYNYGE